MISLLMHWLRRKNIEHAFSMGDKASDGSQAWSVEECGGSVLGYIRLRRGNARGVLECASGRQQRKSLIRYLLLRGT